MPWNAIVKDEFLPMIEYLFWKVVHDAIYASAQSKTYLVNVDIHTKIQDGFI